MSSKIPKTIGPVTPQGNEFRGIFYQLKNKYHIADPIRDGVYPSSFGTEFGNIGTLVMWNETKWRTDQDKNAYAMLSFPDRKIIPTAYSMRGIKGGYTFQVKWIVYGITNENLFKDPSYWDILSDDDYIGSNFCQELNNDGWCDYLSISTFQMNKINHSYKAYSHIRFVQKEGKDDSNPRFAASGIDIYGTLISVNDCPTIYISNQKILHIIYTFIFFMSK